MRKILRIIGIIVLLSTTAGACLACASAPVIPAERKIDALFTPGNPATEREKKIVQIAKEEIIIIEKAKEKAEKAEKASAAWASRGKYLTAGGIVLLILICIGIGARIARRFII